MPNLLIVAGTAGFAAAEFAGDKVKNAPDRAVLIGLKIRGVTAVYAGAGLAPRDKRVLGRAIAVAAWAASSYAGLAAHKLAMRRYGQTAIGLSRMRSYSLAGWRSPILGSFRNVRASTRRSIIDEGTPC